uniref:Uncharacterized protein n=1 Tax=Spongospora subterranea TaxID=70186 RepID=A0A0H5QVU7_9EUKA|eukprot:CRZ06045.1 hypothetical protein [Spongospora subterranea]
MGRSINASNSSRVMRLDRLATHFMMTVCGVTASLSEVLSISDIVRTTIEYRTTLSTREQLFECIDSLTDLEQKANIGTLLHRYLAELEKPDSGQINLSSTAADSNEEESGCEQGPAGGEAKRRRCGDDDLPVRHQFKNLAPYEKLEQVVKIYQTVADQRDLTSNARTLFLNVVTPIFNCLSNHFASSQSDFFIRYPNIAHSTFRAKVYIGKGTVYCDLRIARGFHLPTPTTFRLDACLILHTF